MKFLITGGCGFIGTRLIERLVADGGHSIRVLDDLSAGSRDALASVCDFSEVDPHAMPVSEGGQVTLTVGSILDVELTRKLAQGINAIVHLAANSGVAPSVENPRYDCETNVIGTFNMLEAARHNQVRRFVFASSGAPIGECEPPIHEELPPHPVSPYGASKLAGEAYCSAYFRTFGVETVALRFGNVYGPGSGTKQSVVAKFIRQAFAGETLEIYGDGGQTRDFIFIGELIGAILRAATVAGVGGEIFQIAAGCETTLTELVDTLVPVLETNGLRDVDVSHGPVRLGDVRRNFSDTSKARDVLGWTAGKDLQGGLDETVQWFLANRPA